MAQITYNTSLQSADFPLLSEQTARTVMVEGNRKSPQEESPQIYYCHNVLPTSEGVDSVGYREEIPAVVPGITTFSEAVTIYGDLKTRLSFSVNTDGTLWILKPAATAWLSIPTVAGIAGKLFTYGTANGITYLFFQGVGCYTYDEDTDTLQEAVLTGISVATSIGLFAKSGYLVIYNTEAVAWSSTIDPTDFSPSSATGAGGGSVADLAGEIVFIVPNSTGFLVYTEANTVSATYTGNRQYPFKFREVDLSKGAASLSRVAFEANSSIHYVYSKAGLQAVSSQRSEILLPEVTDFLGGRTIEDFDPVTDEFTSTELAITLQKRLTFIGSRYLVISYGATTYTHALVYDVALKKLGKLRHTHVDCFEYIDDQQEVSKDLFALLSADGTVNVVNFSDYSGEGVLITGKYQYVRHRHLILQKVQVANVRAGDSFTCTSLVSLDGESTWMKLPGYLAYSGAAARDYNFLQSGVNHSLVFTGTFKLKSLTVTFSLGGKR